MPSYSLDLRDPQVALRILVCLVEQSKRKELQFPAEDYDSLTHGKLLLVDYSRKKGVISLRVTSDNGAAIPVAPEAHQWVKPPEAGPLERARLVAEQEAERSGVKSDEELAALEEEMERRQAVARLAKEGKSPMRLKTVK